MKGAGKSKVLPRTSLTREKTHTVCTIVATLGRMTVEVRAVSKDPKDTVRHRLLVIKIGFRFSLHLCTPAPSLDEHNTRGGSNSTVDKSRLDIFLQLVKGM